eukprot:1225724-Pleurochrysis_carterae.AAC.2
MSSTHGIIGHVRVQFKFTMAVHLARTSFLLEAWVPQPSRRNYDTAALDGADQRNEATPPRR